MSLVSLINQHALSAAQAGDWDAVASTLNALTQEVRVTELRSARWLMKQLKDPVSVVGGVTLTEADIVLGTLQATTIPRVKAAYDSLVGDGLDLSDEQIQSEIPSLAAAGNWPTGLATKVMQAGRSTEPLLPSPVTAAECSAAWLVGADCLLSINRTGGQLKICMNVYRDGQQVRLAVINEGEGSDADKALTNTIEAALDRWLQAGG
jgi:hypothetical protein